MFRIYLSFLSSCERLRAKHPDLSLIVFQLARNLLVAAAEQFSLVFQADQSRLFPLYLAAIVYILLGDRLDAPQQKFQAYNTAADGFARLFALLPPPSEAAPPMCVPYCGLCSHSYG